MWCVSSILASHKLPVQKEAEPEPGTRVLRVTLQRAVELPECNCAMHARAHVLEEHVLHGAGRDLTQGESAVLIEQLVMARCARRPGTVIAFSMRSLLSLSVHGVPLSVRDEPLESADAFAGALYPIR